MTETVAVTHLVFLHCLVGTREAIFIKERMTRNGINVAASVGVPSGSLWTPADCHVVLDCAVGTLTTEPGQSSTGVHTLVVLADQLRVAVRVLLTVLVPGNTARVRVAVVTWQTLTLRAATDIHTLGPGAADSLHTGVSSAVFKFRIAKGQKVPR